MWLALVNVSLLFFQLIRIVNGKCEIEQNTLFDGEICSPNCTGQLSVVASEFGFYPNSSFTFYPQYEHFGLSHIHKDCRCFCIRVFEGYEKYRSAMFTMLPNTTTAIPYSHVGDIQHLPPEVYEVHIIRRDDLRGSEPDRYQDFPIITFSPHAFSNFKHVNIIHFEGLKFDNPSKTFLPLKLNHFITRKCNMVSLPDAFFEVTITETLQLESNMLKIYPEQSKIPLSWKDINTIYLHDNPSLKFPTGVFAQKRLQLLDIQGINDTEVFLTKQQIVFLERLHAFFHSKYRERNCTRGSLIDVIHRSKMSACLIDEKPPTPTNSGKAILSPPPTTSTMLLPTPTMSATNTGNSKSGRNTSVPRPAEKKNINESKMSSSEASNTVYIIILVLLAIIFLTLLVCCFCPRRNVICSDDDNLDQFGKYNELNLIPTLTSIYLPFDEVTLFKEISVSTFGEVWLGYYQNFKVAIKLLVRTNASEDEIDSFVQEIKIMSTLNHSKIVRFVGATWTSRYDIRAVTEFMDRGDLCGLLQSKSINKLCWRKGKIDIAIDIASALHYLHTHSSLIIHRNLKSRNILLDSWSGAKLSDFAISKMRSNEESLTAEIGTGRWMAPEVITGGQYNQMCDIYSFGVVLSELDSHKMPYDGEKEPVTNRELETFEIVAAVARGTIKPKFSSKCPDSIRKIADKCLEYDPNLRPQAGELVRMLESTISDERYSF